VVPVNSILPENLPEVKPQSSSPFLVHNGQSGTVSWNRRQRRTFQRLMSWCTYMTAQGFQVVRADLTTAAGGSAADLTKDFKKLRRRVERKFVGYRLHFFKVQTCEGNGVLHMVWAIKWDRAIWISQAWLKEEWLRIHGASIVYIKRMGKGKFHIKRVGRYLAVQYLSRQDAMVRVSWSWWRDGLAIGKAWGLFKRWCWQRSPIRTMCGLNDDPWEITYKDMIRGWEEILSKGWWMFKGCVFFISGRSVDMGVC